MGKHRKPETVPSTGTGHAGGHGPKPAKTQISQVSAGGAVHGGETSKLWGWRSSGK